MLNSNEIRLNYERTLNALGTSAVVERVSGDSYPCTVGINSKPNEELMNAYGVNVRVVTVLLKEVPELTKLDKIIIDNERHTIDDIHIARINDLKVSHVCIVRGK